MKYQLLAYILFYQLLAALHVSAIPRPQGLETTLTLLETASSTGNGSAVENTPQDPTAFETLSRVEPEVSSSVVITIGDSLTILRPTSSVGLQIDTSSSVITSTNASLSRSTTRTHFLTILPPPPPPTLTLTSTPPPPPPSPPPPPPPTPPITETGTTITFTATATAAPSSAAPTNAEEPLRYQGIFGLSLWAKIVIPLALASTLGFGMFLCVAHRKNMVHKKALSVNASRESVPAVMREAARPLQGRRLTL